ncbi:MAG: CDP-alcohol phosphatidyltransferase family protein [Clostridia bacterium]|nr:CDP-alcohol phosphatidyltransferase family protein [Clostridia bacterium]
MNLPNILSLIRVLLVPAFVVTLIAMRNVEIWGIVVPIIIYIITALTDMLDGMIARKYNLITDFGKFIDPLADKFMVISSMIAILVWMLIPSRINGYNLGGDYTLAMVFLAALLVVFLRELGVTTLRMVVNNTSGEVVAASWLGKIKTVSQMGGTVIILLEPLIPFFNENHILSYICIALILLTTLVSGIDYLRAYLPHIDSNK